MADKPKESWVLIPKPDGIPGYRWIPRAAFEEMQRRARERQRDQTPDGSASR